MELNASRRRAVLLAAFIGTWMATTAVPVQADLTGFVGAGVPSGPAPAFGFAFGRWPRWLGFEIEFARAAGDPSEGRPSVTTFSGSFLARVPRSGRSLQLYGEGGVGIHGQSLGDGRGATGSATSLGAGMTSALKGPLMLRVDYRFFALSDSLDYRRMHSVYAGLSLAY
jgi:hypothetical protein